MKSDIRLKMTFDSLLNPKYRWYFHIIFWLLVFAQDIDSIVAHNEFNNTLLFMFFLEMLIVYFNIYYLFKKFLIKGKLIRYGLINIIIIIAYGLINYYLFFDGNPITVVECTETGETHEHYNTILSISLAFVFRIFSIIGTAIGIKFFKRYFLEQKKMQELKQDNLENELQYLKNQINPHFLFNSLNNVYILSKKSQEETSESILLLSDLLRYQLYDCSKEKVLLQDEIAYLKNFFKLEKLRKVKSTIHFDIDGNPNGILIAPFLFMPFVENSIKYGTLAANPEIKLQFIIKDNYLEFNLHNNKPEIISNSLKGGIGIKNVKRRLTLLYPNKHILNIIENQETYTVNLKLEL